MARGGSHHCVQEHRYVMAQILGRPLRQDEQVHHRDGDRSNNTPTNLELRRLHHGNGASITPAAEELLARIAILYTELEEAKARLVQPTKIRDFVVAS